MAFTFPTYLVRAYDSNHQWLDVDPQGRRDGYPTFIDGAGPMLEFVGSVKTGLLRDVDDDEPTHTTRHICYWVVSVDGVAREVFTTSYGRTCTRTMAGIKDYGPGCAKPAPVPALRKAA